MEIRYLPASGGGNDIIIIDRVRHSDEVQIKRIDLNIAEHNMAGEQTAEIDATRSAARREEEIGAVGQIF